MKKAFLLLSAILFAFAACNPENPENPENPDEGGKTGKGEFTLTSAAEVTVGPEGETVKVEFTSTVDWAAKLDVESTVATLNVKSGSAEDNYVKVTVKPFEKTNASRVITLTITPDGLSDTKVVITQNGEFEPFFEVSTTRVVAEAAGGEVSFEVNTNVEFQVATDEDTDQWAEFTMDGNVGTFRVDPTTEFGPREGYVTITVPSIQVPVVDEGGNPTGEAHDLAVFVYIVQKGHAELEWMAELPAEVTGDATNYSLANWAGVLLLCNGPKLFMVNTANGEILTPVETGIEDKVMKCITTDDAGTLLFVFDGEYTQGVTVFAKPVPGESEREDKVLLYWPNIYYGYGLNNIKAKGDVYGQAVVTLFNGGAPSYSGTNACLYWNVGEGSAAWEQNAEEVWITKPTGNIVPDHMAPRDNWDSYRCLFAPVGPRVSDGFIYNGYDGQYKYLYYNGSAWNEVLSTPYTWEMGWNSLASINWDGEDYSVGIGMSYFPCWAIPSEVWLMKGNGSTLEPLAALKYIGETIPDGSDSNHYAYKPSATDVILAIEGNKLAAYIVDGALNVILKYSFSK